MKNEVEKIIYDGQKFTSLGFFKSLESAHSEHNQYSSQLTFEEVDEMNRDTPYVHLVEYRDGEHHNDLYFIWPRKIVARADDSVQADEEKKAKFHAAKAVCTSCGGIQPLHGLMKFRVALQLTKW